MISYWQSADKLFKLDSSAWFMVKHTNFETNESEWTVERDLIDMDLSTDREDQNCIYSRYVGNEITGFRFETTAPAVGSRNLGRISLGSIYLVYSD